MDWEDPSLSDRVAEPSQTSLESQESKGGGGELR